MRDKERNDSTVMFLIQRIKYKKSFNEWKDYQKESSD